MEKISGILDDCSDASAAKAECPLPSVSDGILSTVFLVVKVHVTIVLPRLAYSGAAHQGVVPQTHIRLSCKRGAWFRAHQTP
jgi:hypothetical protein